EAVRGFDYGPYDAAFTSDAITAYEQALTDQTAVPDAVATLLAQHDGFIVSDTGSEPGTLGFIPHQSGGFKRARGGAVYLDILRVAEHQTLLDVYARTKVMPPGLDAVIDGLPARNPGLDPGALRRLLVAAGVRDIRVVAVGGEAFKDDSVPVPE